MTIISVISFTCYLLLFPVGVSEKLSNFKINALAFLHCPENYPLCSSWNKRNKKSFLLTDSGPLAKCSYLSGNICVTNVFDYPSLTIHFRLYICSTNWIKPTEKLLCLCSDKQTSMFCNSILQAAKSGAVMTICHWQSLSVANQKKNHCQCCLRRFFFTPLNFNRRHHLLATINICRNSEYDLQA